MDLNTKITQLYSQMTGSEKKIAEFILHNTAETLTMNLRMLAEAVGVSSATVVRFVRAVGFDSFIAMRMALACGVQPQDIGGKPQLPPRDFSLDFAELQLGDTVLSAIVQTRRLQTRAALSAAAEGINAARALYLYGVGTSGMAADAFQHKMVNINKPCQFYHDGSLSVIGTAHALKGTAALGISYSGRNREVLFAMESCHNNGALTIGVTQVNSPLTKYLDVLLPIPYIEDGLCEGGNLSIYAQMTALDMLYLSLLNIARQDKEKTLIESKQAVARHAQDMNARG